MKAAGKQVRRTAHRAAQAPARAADRNEEPVLGTAYYPDYFPEAVWADDLDRMVAARIGCVRVLEFAWCWYQPEPRRFRWDGLDRFLDLCHARGLRVCLATPTATPPPWFFDKYPDARLMGNDGRACFAHRHMTCWNHPQARREAFRTIRALAKRYGRHPAVWGWQIDNEPNYAEDPKGFYDFNPHALAAGRCWLRGRYGTLENLNRAWFAAFWSQAVNAWPQVWATHAPLVNPQSRLDFLRWREANMAAFVQDQAAILRTHTRGQAIGVNIPETGVAFSVAIGQDYWAQAAGMDWVGTDLYAGSHDEAADLAGFRQNCDIMRSVAESARPGGAAFILSECQGGPHVRAWHGTFACQSWEPGYLKRCTELFVERGASQIWYFLWRPTSGGTEMGMNGVQDLDGHDTANTDMLRTLGARRKPLRRLAAAYQARPLALIHYSRDTMRFLHGMEPLEAVARSLAGVHRRLDQQGYRISVVTDSQLDAAAIPDADMLVLAESHLLSTRAQQAVLAWVQGNARRMVHLGPHTALLDERGQLFPPSQRWLWHALGVEPGALFDQAVALRVGRVQVKAFRALRAAAARGTAGATQGKGALRYRGHSYPQRIQVGRQIVVHACREDVAGC